MVSLDFNVSNTDSLNESVISYVSVLRGFKFSVGRIVRFVMAHVCHDPRVNDEERRVGRGTNFIGKKGILISKKLVNIRRGGWRAILLHNMHSCFFPASAMRI